MTEAEQPNDDLQAAMVGNKVFIRVSGRGSFKVSASLKQFIMEVTSKLPLSVVVLDLADCIGMDSTFMGVLAGLSGRLKQFNQTLELIHLSEKNRALLATLGVDQVIAHYGNSHGHELPAEISQTLPIGSATKKDLAETALQAHETLSELSEENRPRFKRVIEYLKADVSRFE
ncbi:MAG: STAS domain-containing protein [Pontiellaceae bacterium]|jgi:anti-anti-sigma regulatory factor|nr:STAS domain-containing protein [Pontiellaceae bacterium]